MFDTQLIHTVHSWEQRLAVEEERRKNHRSEPYVNYLAKPQSTRKVNRSIFARFFHFTAGGQPAAQPQAQECCEGMQPG